MPAHSGKQRKAQLQLKRAVKRGDAPKPDPVPTSKHKRSRPPPKPGHTLEAREATDQAVKAARKLQSTFMKLDRGFLEETRRLAGSIVLTRPIQRGLGVLTDEWITPIPTVAGADLGNLSVPKRPKWKYTMTKEEVDANEQGHFRKWLSQQDTTVARWQNALNAQAPQCSNADQVNPPADPAGLVADHGDAGNSETHEMPHPPTHFERNLEVWRQFWRVTEISQILLVLLDSRCPPLHLPPSLATYLNLPNPPPPTVADTIDKTSAQSTSRRSNARFNAPRVILVLTKVDISGPTRTESWTSLLNVLYPGVPVVPVEAYAPKYASTSHATESNVQGRVQYEPYLPGTFRETLVYAMKEAHALMLRPPEWVTAARPGESEEERMQRVGQWRPRVRREVDWERVLRARGKMVGKAIGGAAVPRGEETDGDDEMVGDHNGYEGGGGEVSGSEEGGPSGDENEKSDDRMEWKEPEFLTVGLIGQPNVGKSSLLNAVFGTTRVRASRTPGKTKHFQTLFWTPDVRLVDCPGLVMPSFVPMDIQVLSGVLPISRISAIPFCVHQIARLLPLERILGLTHPSLSTSPAFAMSASNTTAATIATTAEPDDSRKPSCSTLKSATFRSSATATPAMSVKDKRTWRPGQRLLMHTKAQSNELKWTANDIMIAYAEKKGWVTAKAGRPDIHRAGNAILRLVAEGKIPWAFWPPGGPSSVADANAYDGNGIWLKDGVQTHGWPLDDDGDEEEDEGKESEEEGSDIGKVSGEEEDMKTISRIRKAASDSSDVDEMEHEEEHKEAEKYVTGGRRGNLGRFGALSIDDDSKN
ncbi:hypothetical protein PAXRUDRAFT_10847 [Paxillus rubicundulus Ve08.2h10]|uniref:Guanine nucleotide-binding protein-like 1 n=1 Tax=Paxillus rubicundulus Ve08.2h10 TaxID=930991 RepID=A0A0D0DFD1_9AGAM|nr:hypothetical protein PAXRUDRAFT_10847 [Paxillus rubicundulus Ve08.2h10]